MRAFLYGSLTIAGLALVSSTAHADRTMVVVVDATGSMTQDRTDPITHVTTSRFEAARAAASQRVFNAGNEAGGLNGGVAVFTFSGPGITAWAADGSVSGTPVFMTKTQAKNVIDNFIAVTPLDTPLADSICATADIASASGTVGVTTARLLEVYSDGGENASFGACSGPDAGTPDYPWTPDSWQKKTYDHLVNELPTVAAVKADFTYFTNVATFARTAVPASAAHDVAASANVRSFALAEGPPSDADFFALLAAGTGGTYTEVADNAALPVFADLDSNFVVDRNDAISLARSFGGPVSTSLDLNADGKIGYGDYAILKGLLGTGPGTPAPDPYTAANVITCHFGQVLTIDGKAIEAAGPTVIDADNLCVLTIKNSLLVSGSFAIKARGLLTVTVDNSIIVGEGSWLSAAPLSLIVVNAKNTVFHGKTTTPYVYVSRGGNTFE